MLKYLVIGICFFSQIGLAQNIKISSFRAANYKLLPKSSIRLGLLNNIPLLGNSMLMRPLKQQLDSILPPFNSPKRLSINRTVVAPALLVGFGFLSLGNPEFLESNEAVQREITWYYPRFHTKIDNYTQYVPLAAVYGLNLAGVKGKHDLLNMTMLYALSSFINSTLTTNIKTLTKERRPDGSSLDAFPSGHTSTAFANAELMHQEYKHLSVWYSVGGYSFAAATGTLRMLNNRHWLSDVAAGAGMGILSTRLAYVIYPWLKEKINQTHLGKEKILVTPIYQQGSYGLMLSFAVD